MRKIFAHRGAGHSYRRFILMNSLFFPSDVNEVVPSIFQLLHIPRPDHMPSFKKDDFYSGSISNDIVGEGLSDGIFYLHFFHEIPSVSAGETF